MNSSTWSAIPYKWYKRNLYPKISEKRGATFLKSILEGIAKKTLSEVSEEKLSGLKDFEWDNLVILDACRHDLYEEVLERETDYRYTLASHSSGFIESNFSSDEYLDDTVVVTANPHYENEISGGEGFRELVGCDAEEVFYEVYRVYNTHWNSEHSTVLPEDMLELASLVKSIHSDKRIILHFMQPHFPFIGSDLGEGKLIDDNNKAPESYVWNEAREGRYLDKELWEAYRKNLEIALKELRDFSELDGRTVITADHGNFVGENGFYGHPRNFPAIEELRKVPFDVLEENSSL